LESSLKKIKGYKNLGKLCGSNKRDHQDVLAPKNDIKNWE
jgi:hypothetical protein